MKKNLLLFAAFLIPILSSAQTIYETVYSRTLEEERQIKIQLPRNYEKNKDKTYPVMVVLDGDYLFEPVAGNVDFYSYWETAPEMIVIGVNQGATREYDAYYDELNFLPSGDGADFFEFVGIELMKYLDKSFRTANFRVIVGHDFTANFINYYLLKPNPVFDGYINLSPDLAPEMAERISSALSRTPEKRWFYMATGSEDIKKLKNDILAFDEKLRTIENKKLDYKFENFGNTSHYTLVGKALPSAIENIFRDYTPISQKEYQEELLPSPDSPVAYLVRRYEKINTQFKVRKKIRINDFLAVYNAIETNSAWEEYKELSALASKHYPDTMLSSFFIARYEEEAGDPEKAFRAYQNAYGQEKIAFLNADYMLQRADQIKKEYGF